MQRVNPQQQATTADRLTVLAPYDGSVIEELAATDPDTVDGYLAAAHARYLDRQGWLPLTERIGILERAARIMLRDRGALARTAASEGGKPLLDSQIEVERAIDTLKLAVETLRTHAGEVVPMGSTSMSAHRLAFTQQEPIGAAVAISAFNHPLNLVAHQVGAALAAGCPSIVKPSPETPLSCLAFVRILREAGLPEAWCRVVLTADNDLSLRLATDPRVGFLSFVGSAAVGWMLRSRIAPGARCALEHGGAAPVILLDDADWETALQKLTRGGFYHAGQVCVSAQRVFVPRARAEEFAERLAERASALRLGDPLDSSTEVGPLIRPAEAERVDSWVAEAVRGGAVTLCGARRRGRAGYEPTVLLDAAEDAAVSTREVFGPVVCVYGYDTADSAIHRANALPFAFQASVFTRDVDRALHVFRHIHASAVMLNDHPAFRVDGMPFAGLGQSGLGRGGMPYSIDAMQARKLFVLNSPAL